MPKTLEGNPFKKCVRCPKNGTTCRGPNPVGAAVVHLAEYFRLRCDYLNTLEPGNWTRQRVAERLNVSIATINRKFSGEEKSLKLDLVTDLLNLLSNGGHDNSPAHFCIEDIVTEDCAEGELERLRAEYASYKEDAAKKIEFLKRQAETNEQHWEEEHRTARGRAILSVILGIALAICLLAIIAALVIDRMNPDVGFLWIDRLSAVFEGEASHAGAGYVPFPPSLII